MRRSIRLKKLNSNLEKSSNKPLSALNITLDDLSSEESEKSAKAASSQESLKEQDCYSISSDEASIIAELTIPALTWGQNSGNVKCTDETLEKTHASMTVEDDHKDQLDVDAKANTNENLKLRRSSRKSKVGASVGQNSRQSIYSFRKRNLSQTKDCDTGEQEIMANVMPRLLSSSQETGMMESDSNAGIRDPGVLVTEEASESDPDSGTLDTSSYSKVYHSEDMAHKNMNLCQTDPIVTNSISRNSMSDVISLNNDKPSSNDKLDADAAIKVDFVLERVNMPQASAICLDTPVAPESVTGALGTNNCSSGMLDGSTDIILVEDKLHLDVRDMASNESVLNVKSVDQVVMGLDDHGDSDQSANEVVYPEPEILQLNINQSSDIISNAKVTESSKHLSLKDAKDTFAFPKTLAGQLGSDPTESLGGLGSQAHNQSFIADFSMSAIPSAKKPAAISLSCNIPFKEHIKAKLLGKAGASAENTASAMNGVCGLNDVQIGQKKISKDYSNKLHSHLQLDRKHGSMSDVNVDQLMKLSVLPENTAKCEKAPKLYESSFKSKKEKKEKAAETAGPGWFNLPKAEITPELKKDLQLMRMRNVLDPKQHYKRSDSHAVPKYFQVGTIIEGAHDFYSSRLPNKQRKKTLVDELLADADFRRRNKRKYLEMQKESMKMGKKFKRKKKLQR